MRSEEGGGDRGSAHKTLNTKLQSCKAASGKIYLFYILFLPLSFVLILHFLLCCIFAALATQQRRTCSNPSKGSGRLRGAVCTVCTLVRVSGLSQKYHTHYEKTLKLAGLKKHVLLCMLFFFFFALCSSCVVACLT